MTSHADIEATASEWLARRDSARWSEELDRELDEWLGLETAHRVAFLRLESVWERTHRLSALKASHTGEASMAKPPAKSRVTAWRFAAVAASVAVVTAGGGYLWAVNDEVAYKTPLGAQRPVVLADGTHVLLNTETKLRVNIDTSHRYVRLDEGEAYFEVTHDPAHPFVVDAGDEKITVLGTKFVVRKDAGGVRVGVVEGRVRVEQVAPGGHGQAAVLTPNDIAIVTPARVVLSRQTPAQMSNEMSWRTGRLSFEDVTLEAAAREFNRYNEKKLVVVDERAGQVRIGGSFSAENVEAFARLLHDGFGLTVRDDGASIRVSS